MNSIKGQRGFQPTQFCPKMHDKNMLGRTNNGSCLTCKLAYDAKWSLENRDKERLMWNRANWNKSQIINPDGTKFTNINYDYHYQKQQGKCFMCNKHQSQLKKPLCADHNHVTKIFRGLLCHSCNVGIGLLGDSIEVLESGIKYLTRGY